MPIIKEDALHTYNPQAFTFNSVKGEVSEAMQFDWKRDKVDDAKKRAIYTATSYDDFTSRVKGCTLKPIHRNEFNAPPKFSFNRQLGNDAQTPLARIAGSDLSATAVRSAVVAGRGTIGGATQVLKTSATLPKNTREFDRELRRLKSANDKVALLADLDVEACAKIFAREVDAELLREIVLALDEGVPPAGLGRRLLRDFALRCPEQTTMATSFFTQQERRAAARVLARDAEEEEGENVRICASFGIPPAVVAEVARSLPRQTVAQEATVASGCAPEDSKTTTSEPTGMSSAKAAKVDAETPVQFAPPARAPAEPLFSKNSEDSGALAKDEAPGRQGAEPECPEAAAEKFSCDDMD